jgi:hypothetical protein
MNPDRALEVLLQTAHQLADGQEPKAQALAEQVLALDEWLSRGAPLPSRWNSPRASVASAQPMIQYRGHRYCRVG